MELSEPQKKYLRGRGHQLKPTVTIGNAGVTESVLAELDSTLAHHELIKVKVRAGDRESRDAAIRNICDAQNATLVQRIGSVALLYRENPDKKPETRLRIPSR